MLPAPLIVALEGPSGAGKTTVARRVAPLLRADLLSEAFSRLSPRPSLAYEGPSELLALERTLLAEERRRYRSALADRRRGRSVLADTGFWGPLTYTAGLVALGVAPRRILGPLWAAARGRGRNVPLGPPDAIVYLDVPDRVLRRRIAADPDGHPAELAARHLAVARFERYLYRERMVSVLPGRIATVPGSDDPDAVARRVRDAVWALPPIRSPSGVLIRVLGEVRTAAAAFNRARPASFGEVD